MGLLSGFVDLFENLFDDVTGRGEAKSANQIAQQQLDLQNKQLAEAKARKTKAELEAEAEAKRAEEERLNTKDVKKKASTGATWGRFIQ